MRADRQTDRQTDTLISILRSPAGGRRSRPDKIKQTAGLELMFRRVEHGHLPGAVNLLAVSRDPLFEVERIAE